VLISIGSIVTWFIIPDSDIGGK